MVLLTGVLDAGFTGVKAANSRKFYEVQKYGVASNIILAFDNLVVNPKWWDGLPADVRGMSRVIRDGKTLWEKPFLTCEANATVGAVHPKAMPVMLRPADVGRWLDSERADACALARPFEDTAMRRVS